ncbi:MAG TPA: alpha/beta fold hydrolase [Candidatus Baltobacteraceae bacterium]|nr:alpha/beta fold hydrolase [Candidatus Baltobacteraceae bacterium]
MTTPELGDAAPADRAGLDADALAASLDAREAPLLDEEMRSTVLHHGERTRRVTVLLHGLTASPRTWKGFARARFERGENVLVPRMPRHGHADRMTGALAELSAHELLTFAKGVVDAASELGDRIVVVGHSLGGAVALHLAQHDARVFRAVAVAPFLGIKQLPHDWHGFVRRVLARAPNVFLWWDPVDRGRSAPKHGYPRYTTRSLLAGLALADALREDAREGPPRAAHVEIVRNAGETSVNNRTIDDLVARWRGAGAKNARIVRLLGLGPSHDVVEPEHRRSPAARFLPALHALLDEDPPPDDRVIAIP